MNNCSGNFEISFKISFIASKLIFECEHFESDATIYLPRIASGTALFPISPITDLTNENVEVVRLLGKNSRKAGNITQPLFYVSRTNTLLSSKKLLFIEISCLNLMKTQIQCEEFIEPIV